MAKIFRGVTPTARPLSRVWSIMKLILRFSTSIIKDWSGPSSLQVSPRIKSLAGHHNSNGSTTLYIRSKHFGAEQMVWLIFTAVVTGDWTSAIPIPCNWLIV